MSVNLIEEVKKNPFLLAPMAGITDSAFRSFMKEMGCGVVISELVSAKGLQFRSQKTLDLMKYSELQKPVGIQIFGEELESLTEAAKIVEDHGADFVDINFGCPVPKVVKKGAGSAALKDLVHLGKIIHAVKSGTKLPVTIKIRTGWDHNTKNSLEVTRVAYEEGVTWVAIHGRTRSQGYSGQADWDYIQEVAQESPLPIIGNGDLVSARLACQRLNESRCLGVMIGRGCLKNPWVFYESQAQYWSSSVVKRDYLSLLERLKYHLEQQYEGKRLMVQLKKLSAWYSAGFPESAQFRQSVFSSGDYNELNEVILNYFSSLTGVLPADTSHEAFLMGGHG